MSNKYAAEASAPTGCTQPKMIRKRKDCGCTSEWVCETCGYSDRRQESEHGEQTCRRLK